MTDAEQKEIHDEVCRRIIDLIRSVYNEEVDETDLHDLRLSLAFKDDPSLNELRLALERLDRKEFGLCVLCANEIAVEVLVTSPTAHFCARCAEAYDEFVKHGLQKNEARGLK